MERGERRVILGLGVAPRTHLDVLVLFVHLFSFFFRPGFLCARVPSITQRVCSDGVGWCCGGGEREDVLCMPQYAS